MCVLRAVPQLNLTRPRSCKRRCICECMCFCACYLQTKWTHGTESRHLNDPRSYTISHQTRPTKWDNSNRLRFCWWLWWMCVCVLRCVWAFIRMAMVCSATVMEKVLTNAFQFKFHHKTASQWHTKPSLVSWRPHVAPDVSWWVCIFFALLANALLCHDAECNNVCVCVCMLSLYAHRGRRRLHERFKLYNSHRENRHEQHQTHTCTIIGVLQIVWSCQTHKHTITTLSY